MPDPNDTYNTALDLLHQYDEARANLRFIEDKLKMALRAYSANQNYSMYIGIDTFRATVTTRERKIA